MLHGSARLCAAAFAIALLLAACQVETLDAVPAYPGSSLGPGYRVKENDVTSLKQIYYTADGYEQVIGFYKNYVAQSPGWQGAPQTDMTIWSNNMVPDQMMTAGKPVDPSKPGKLIVVVNEGMRTVVRAFSSHPGT